MVLLKYLRSIFTIPELARKVSFTLGVLVVYRIGVHIPVPGINVELLTNLIQQQASLLSGFLGYLDTFSGGALRHCALFALGINPYITASIFMQVVTMAIPYFEALSKEGEYGRMQINQYTRYLTLILSIIYSVSFLGYLGMSNLILNPSLGFYLFFVLSMVTGSLFVMWLGEQVSLLGLGNGSSFLIFASIISDFPGDVAKTIGAVQAGTLTSPFAVMIGLFFFALAAAVVYLEKGERKIPVQYARRVIGNKLYGGQSSYIPFKINNVGVMPAIFATSVLSIPQVLIGFLGKFIEVSAFKDLFESFARGGMVYNVLIFVLIILFTFVYTSMFFDPQELANNLKKNGGFVPGIRPGQQTADYFDYILTRIGLAGALYLAGLSLLPSLFNEFIIAVPFALSGTSLLIVVGVALEVSSQIQAYLLEQNYAVFSRARRREV